MSPGAVGSENHNAWLRAMVIAPFSACGVLRPGVPSNALVCNRSIVEKDPMQALPVSVGRRAVAAAAATLALAGGVLCENEPVMPNHTPQ